MSAKERPRATVEAGSYLPNLPKGAALTEPPGFAEFDKGIAEYAERMEDPQYRAAMNRTTPLTEAEEQEMYAALDALLGDETADGDAGGDIDKPAPGK